MITPLRKSVMRMSVTVLLVFIGIGMHTVDAAGPFTDVDEGSEYDVALSFLKVRGVIGGYPDGSFQPERVVNRAEALKMFIVGHKKEIPESLSRSGFPDIPSGSWYEDFVYFAKSKQYIGGYPDGSFKPEQSVNKVEALKMLFSVGGLSPKSTNSGGEIDEDQWFAGYLLEAYKKNLIDASRPSSYDLTAEVTRGELATMLYRFLYIKDQGIPVYENNTEGRVSYYADEFNGRSTSSGDLFDNNLFTAAHPSLPFGTFVQVNDPKNQNSVLVRVNDRGPFGGGVLDLSKKAFQEFYTASKGIFNGKVQPLQKVESYVAKKYYTSSSFPGVTVSRKVPSMFQKGEMYVLQGNLSGVAPLLVYIKYPNGSEQSYEYHPNGKTVAIPLYFPEVGEYVLSIHSRGVQHNGVPVYVTDGLFGKALRKIDPSSAQMSVETVQEGISMKWKTGNDTNMYKLVLSKDGQRKVFYINTVESAVIDKTLLGGMTMDNLNIELYGANSTTYFLHDVSTNWALLSSHTMKSTTTPVANTSNNTNINTNAESTVNTSTPGVEVSGSQREQMLSWINVDRLNHNAQPLELNATLNSIAQEKAEDMARNNYFDHKNLQGEYVNDWKDQFGFTPLISENIAFTSQGFVHSYSLFQDSPSHFANMIDPTFEIVGLGIAVEGAKMYVVQEFSTKPLSSSSTTSLRDEILLAASKGGLIPIQHSGLTHVSQDWATYLADTDTISLNIGGQSALAIAKEKTGISSLDSFVSEADNLDTIKTNVARKLAAYNGEVQLGLGVGQSDSGGIYVTLIIRK